MIEVEENDEVSLDFNFSHETWKWGTQYQGGGP